MKTPILVLAVVLIALKQSSLCEATKPRELFNRWKCTMVPTPLSTPTPTPTAWNCTKINTPATPSPTPRPLLYLKFDDDRFYENHGAQNITTDTDGHGLLFRATEDHQDYIALPLLDKSCLYNKTCVNGYTISGRVRVQQCISDSKKLKGFMVYNKDFEPPSFCYGLTKLSFPDNQWMRLTLVNESQPANEIRIYVDGVKTFTRPGEQSLLRDKYLVSDKTQNLGVLYVSGMYEYFLFLRFDIDDFMVWDIPLTHDDVKAIGEDTVPYPGSLQ